MSIEQLVRINAKGINLEGVSGGRSDFTTADISACLAGADNIGVMVLMRRVADDTSAHKQAYRRLVRGVIRVAKQNRWNLTNCDKVKALLNLCLYEYIYPIKCPTCRGTGYYRYKECGTCHGTTNYALNDTQKAYAIGVHKSTWKRTWSARHRQVSDYLSEALPDHESRAVNRFYKLMKSRD